MISCASFGASRAYRVVAGRGDGGRTPGRKRPGDATGWSDFSAPSEHLSSAAGSLVGEDDAGDCDSEVRRRHSRFVPEGKCRKRRNRTNARMISTFTSTAREDRRTLESMATHERQRLCPEAVAKRAIQKGCGRRTRRDRLHFFSMAQGPAMESSSPPSPRSTSHAPHP